MSTFGNLVGGNPAGDSEQKEDVPLQDAASVGNNDGNTEGGLEIPTWAWGAAAGGLAALAGIGTSIWHFATRSRRREQARASALQMIQEQSDMTPRDNSTPRPLLPPPNSTPPANLV